MAEPFVPALRFSALTPLYDRVVGATMRERTFRSGLLERVAAGAPGDVLDLGCGTGSLLAELAAALPAASLTGIDPDRQVLARATDKLGDRADLLEASAAALPFADASFDRVASSLVLHHLPIAVKRAALAEAQRALRPGGALHIADWGRPHDPLMRVAFLPVRALDGWSNTGENAAGLIPRLVAEAGFVDVAVTGRMRTVFGTVEYVDALR